MKLLVTGDWHLRFLAPQNRVDNFFNTQFNKVKQVFTIAEEYGCEVILQPGDLWDAHNPSRYVMACYINLFLAKKHIKFFTVLGQHDMTMRSWHVMNRTATYLFQAAHALTILGPECKHILLESKTGLPVALFGLSYGQDYKIERNKDAFNILLSHASVGDKPLFPGHELAAPRKYIRQHQDMDLIVLGDYHYPFYDKYLDTEIINAGCLIRKTVSKWDLEHKPKVVVYDTETREKKDIFIKISSAEDVFTIPDKPVEEKGLLEGLLSTLKSERVLSVDFDENLRLFCENLMTSDEVIKYISHKRSLLSLDNVELKEVSND